jgi:hypothetical protein
MHSEEFDEPNNRTDKRIFHVLAHGQKRQYEIARLAESREVIKHVIKDRVRNLAESYPWAEEVEEEGNTYYYRIDVGRQPTFRNPPADFEDIEELLTSIEMRLGIKSRDKIGLKDTSPKLPILFERLFDEASEHGQILTTEHHLNRFAKCFDRMLEQTKNGFATDQPANYPNKNHGLFYTVIARQQEGWKQGHANEAFSRMVQQKVDGLLGLLDSAPPKIGNTVMRVLQLINIKIAQEGFIKMIQSNNYSEAELVTHAQSCYGRINDTDEMIDHISMVGIESDDDDIKNKINSILDAVDYYSR